METDQNANYNVEGAATDSPNTLAGDLDDKKDDEEATFPQQLMDAVEQETKDGATINGQRVLEWLPAGDSFVIRDKIRFEEEVLPRHFSARCKFLSFVRKLYRWGFRQVQKSKSGIKTFTHTHFLRGDKQRCLRMRSIVKKQSPAPPQQTFTGLAGVAAGQLQALGSNDRYGMMGLNTVGNANAARHQLAQQAPRQIYPTSFNGGVGGNSLGNSNSIGRGGPASSLFTMSNRLSPGPVNTTVKTVLETRLLLERMEQRQQLIDLLNNSHGPFVPSFDPTPVATMAHNNYFCNSQGGGGSNMSAVELSSGIMKQVDPAMEPIRVLELAEHFQSVHGGQFYEGPSW